MALNHCDRINSTGSFESQTVLHSSSAYEAKSSQTESSINDTKIQKEAIERSGFYVGTLKSNMNMNRTVFH